MIGGMVLVLLAATLWIRQLHRKVEQRTAQLSEQIYKRQMVEQRQALQQERARIAQDLHDELGCALTEVSLIASLPVTAQNAQSQISEVGSKARQIVATLDEIVWATNPKHDSMVSLGQYLCLYADRFLKKAEVTLHVKHSLNLPEQALNPIQRHEIFLAFKEALSNVVRHSGANEVWLGLCMVQGKLRLSISDNGCGLKTGQPAEGADGLNNMRERLKKLGGRFCTTSLIGRGTVLRFYIPLNENGGLT